MSSTLRGLCFKQAGADAARYFGSGRAVFRQHFTAMLRALHTACSCQGAPMVSRWMGSIDLT